MTADVAIIGGGLGGVAAALAALRRGRTVVMSEEHPWLGGQLTSQAVPPDEHIWVEQFGVTASYRALRQGIRRYYRDFYPLTDASRRDLQLNPGLGRVSKLCHEPRVAVAAIEALLAAHRSTGRLTVLARHVPARALVDGDRVRALA
ncbi:MAG TPA: FAD-dependent oxidoreductase, partial [Agromyces sp.]|nr:FAD-dependent oxidoreductase [Agromyces sp.]